MKGSGGGGMFWKGVCGGRGRIRCNKKIRNLCRAWLLVSSCRSCISHLLKIKKRIISQRNFELKTNFEYKTFITWCGIVDVCDTIDTFYHILQKGKKIKYTKLLLL
jgi:hypothetical protein